MYSPLVTAVCLTADRPDFLDRAVRCFLRQTYEEKRMLVFDSGKKLHPFERLAIPNLTYVPRPEARGLSIGELRNLANAEAESDIIMHWDDDDYSAPERMTDQVALLLKQGTQVVGYRQMLFWTGAEAWLYQHGFSHYAVGTSLCYWRSAWATNPFQHSNSGEDAIFTRAVACYGVISGVPMMIAQIHNGNTSSRITPKDREWRRSPEWDQYCKETMEAA